MNLEFKTVTLPSGSKVQSVVLSGFIPAPGSKKNLLIDSTILGVGVNLNAPKVNGFTLLHLAAAKNKVDVATALLSAGADVNVKDGMLITPLHLAASSGFAVMVKLLLANKAEVDVKSVAGFMPSDNANAETEVKMVRGFTALQLALEKHVNVAEILIGHGADVCAKNAHDSALHLATKNIESLKLVLAEIGKKCARDAERLRAVMNVQDTEGDTPIMWTVEAGNLNETKLLLACEGIEINTQNVKGWTVLHWVAHKGQLEIVKLVLDKKADPKIKDKNGETAYDLALAKISEDVQYQIIADFLVGKTNASCLGRLWCC